MPKPSQRIHYRDDVTRYFMDTEFSDNGHTIDLISIALVADDARELYLCNKHADLAHVDPWVKANVVPHLPPVGSDPWRSRTAIRTAVKDFVLATVTPTRAAELWCYYGAYDMVVLAQLFGRLVDMPAGFPQRFMDLKQLSVELGSPPHPPQAGKKHDALDDARWNRDLFNYLRAR